MSRRRYVARGVPGAYRIWDNRARQWWGDLYELCPGNLVSALNSGVSHAEPTAAVNRARSIRRLPAPLGMHTWPPALNGKEVRWTLIVHLTSCDQPM